MSPFFVFINMDINYTFNNYGNFDTSEILRKQKSNGKFQRLGLETKTKEVD